MLVPADDLDNGFKCLLLAELILTAAGLLIAGTNRTWWTSGAHQCAVLFVRERPHNLVPSKAMAKILEPEPR